MSDTYYKGYWMVTNRCNFNCSYCVLEDAPHQLKAELSLEAKKEMISHLYEKLGFRRLTLSGGEVLIMGKSAPRDFIELLRHIRQYRSSDPVQNLEIELYTNGTFLDEKVAHEMQGVVDLVAITIDSSDRSFLTQIGRTNRKFNDYYTNVLKVCALLAQKNIQLKLHSVVGMKNYTLLPQEVAPILDAVLGTGIHPICWKFYQYMSYDAPEKDQLHAVAESLYQNFQEQVEKALEGRQVKLHFKDNEEMNASLFNILAYGNAQYMRDNDTWLSSQRTHDLRSYPSMSDLFQQHDIDEKRFRAFHEIRR